MAMANNRKIIKAMVDAYVASESQGTVDDRPALLRLAAALGMADELKRALVQTPTFRRYKVKLVREEWIEIIAPDEYTATQMAVSVQRQAYGGKTAAVEVESQAGDF